jgi:hypothetical protein
VLLQALQVLCVRETYYTLQDDGTTWLPRSARDLAQCSKVQICQCVRRLITEVCRDNKGNGEFVRGSVQQLIQHEIETQLPTALILTQVFRNNERLLTVLTPEMIESLHMPEIAHFVR